MLTGIDLTGGKNKHAIELIDIGSDPRWDVFVGDHPFGWLYHLSSWKKVLETSFRHMTGHYLAILGRNREILAGLPIYEVRSYLTGRRLVSIPFATLSDPLVTDRQSFTALFEAILDQFCRGGKTRIELRTHQALDSIRNNQLACTRFYKHHFLDLSRGPEALRKGFHRSCIRQRITRAEKSGLQLRIGANQTDLRQYYNLHMRTRKNVGRPTQPYRFFEALWDNLYPRELLTLLLAEKDEIPVAGMILLHFKTRVSAEFAASDERFRNLSPNHFLFWQAILMAHGKGYAIFDFGRTSITNKPLMQFKERWGAEAVDLPHFQYAHKMKGEGSPEANPMSYRLMSRICRKAPDTLQSIIGNFCYRHLG